ncbi:hypothetical protein ACOSP7_009067 [Xanthoceras sorbifolium]
MGASQSTSSTNHGNRKYDAFLSFRGEDTRNSFKSHLYRALSSRNILTFVDDKLKRGDEISLALLKAIEDSKISLVKIIDCKKMNGQIVVPVFYHGNPSDVRKQTGSYKDAFQKHEQEFQQDNDKKLKLQKWRAALTEASNLSGWDSSVIWPESRLVDEIVKDISQKLNDISSPSEYEGLVGINSRIDKVKSLICIGMSDFRIVGIWGIGGIGKTTIAESILYQSSSQFEGQYFIANVREESGKPNGLVHLREKVLSKILEEEYVDLGTNILQFTKDRLQRKRVLIVLDDVSTLKQLEILAKGLNGFGPGSRVIITTRDKQLLCNYGVDKIYEVEAFDKHEALQLFRKYAFKDDHPCKDLTVFAEKVVDYAKGNPLALKVVGSSLHQKSKQQWESALLKLNKISNPEIHNLLRISFDGLDDEEKDIFLDIACFFKGEHKDSMTQILDGCYFSAEYALSVLVDKSLITISCEKIEMHDLLQEMGCEIIRQESVNKPGKRSRLHNHEDICLVLKRNIGTEAIKGMFLDTSKIRKLDLSSQAFEKMCNLKFLKIYNGTSEYGNPIYFSKVHLPRGLDHLPDELRYLYWDGYPSKFLPSNLSLENLVELNLSYSNVEQLWEGKQEAPKLKRLNLSHSRHLTKIPDLSNIPCLEVIILVCCTSLLYDPISIQHLNDLRFLSLKGCENLRSFPHISGNIRELHLSSTTIEEVPSSIEGLRELFVLDLSDCASLRNISTSICKLKSLRKLDLKGCSKLESFPEILETMERLEDVDLSATAIKELPHSIEHLSGLLRLFLRSCKTLAMLPGSLCSLSSLFRLDLSDCSKLERLPENLGNLNSLKHLLVGGTALSRLPSSVTGLKNLELLECSGCSRGLTVPPSLGLLSSLRKLYLNDCKLTEIPEDISCLTSLEVLKLSENNFESLPKSIKQLSKLRWLLLNDCNMLRSLTELPLGLDYLEARNCKELQSLPDASKFAELVTQHCIDENSLFVGLDLIFTNCLELDQRVFSNALADSLLIIQRLASAEKEYQKAVDVGFCYPGSEIPEWFDYQSCGSLINIQLPQQHDWCDRKFLGFALCAVIAFEEYYYEDINSFAVPYDCHFVNNNGDGDQLGGYLTINAYGEYINGIFIDTDHVVLGYRDYSNVILCRDDYTTCSVEFLPPDTNPGCEVKCCGVCPIYAEPNNTGATSISVIEKFDDINQEYKKARKFHDDEANTSTNGRSEEEDMEPNSKRICREANRCL